MMMRAMIHRDPPDGCDPGGGLTGCMGAPPAGWDGSLFFDWLARRNASLIKLIRQYFLPIRE
jgi:hypothetical protein